MSITSGGEPWKIFVVQHSHIDIGFTDRQEAIAEYHAQFIEQAVALARDPRQQERSDATKFKFTCEGFWQVEQFLQRRSSEAHQAFIECARSGSIELTAFYLHFTELLDAGHLADTLQPAVAFAHAHGIPLNAAMSCDVNGMSWAMADAMADAGVKYLNTNINTHHGGFPLGGPLKPFYWETPSGKRILVWSGLPYHKANLLGIMGGWSPTSNPGFPGMTVETGNEDFVDVHDIGFMENRLTAALASLEQQGYPYRFLPVMGSGTYTDNSPPSDSYCEIIAEWNRKHGDRVHLQTATLDEFFQYLETAVPDIPTYKGEWTDWWSDGAASTPVDTALFRNAQRSKRLIERLDPDGKTVDTAKREDISRSLAIYAEHTFGYSDTWRPTLLGQQVFLRKTKTAVDADMLAATALDEVLRAKGAAPFTARRSFTYRVLNALPVKRKGLARLPIDFWETEILASPYSIVANGVALPCQIERDSRGLSILALVEVEGNESLDLEIVLGNAGPTQRAAEQTEGRFENAFYTLKWSDGKGITAYVDRASGVSILPDAPVPGLGAPIYQVFPGGQRGDAAGFGMAPRTIPPSEIHEGICRSCRIIENGPICATLRAEYDVPGATSYTITARLYHELPKIDLSVALNKIGVMDPEGMYTAFPFALDNAIWNLDKPGGPIRPGIDQIPGTCCDYYLVQDGAAYVGQDTGIAWTTLDAPLIHVGGLNLWKFQTTLQPVGPIYSWLTNNKWETNFRISCGGQYEFRYALEAGPNLTDPAAAIETCRSNANPFVTIRTG